MISDLRFKNYDFIEVNLYNLCSQKTNREFTKFCIYNNYKKLIFNIL